MTQQEDYTVLVDLLNKHFDACLSTVIADGRTTDLTPKECMCVAKSVFVMLIRSTRNPHEGISKCCQSLESSLFSNPKSLFHRRRAIPKGKIQIFLLLSNRVCRS